MPFAEAFLRGARPVRLDSSEKSRTERRFLISSSNGGGGDGYILIFDHTGELVWWHQSSVGGVTRARMAYDGQAIYARDGNPGASATGGKVERVSMDGLSSEPISVPSGHHDMTTSPDNGILLLVGGGGDGCSQVEKMSADGSTSIVYDLRDAFGDAFQTGNDPCHCNSIHYNTGDDSISVSCLNQNAFVKISAAGELIWVLGGNGTQSQFTGDVQWSRQHGHQMLSPTKILFFNNNGLDGGQNVPSLIVELELDLDAMTATRGWTYEGGESSMTLGDVARLPNGNTLVTYCNAGVWHEVDADRNLVQRWEFPGGTG